MNYRMELDEQKMSIAVEALMGKMNKETNDVCSVTNIDDFAKLEMNIARLARTTDVLKEFTNALAYQTEDEEPVCVIRDDDMNPIPSREGWYLCATRNMNSKIPYYILHWSGHVWTNKVGKVIPNGNVISSLCIAGGA